MQIGGVIAADRGGGRRTCRCCWLGVLLFGLGIGNATSLPPLIAQVEFVGDDVPRVVALTVAIGQAVYALRAGGLRFRPRIRRRGRDCSRQRR